MPRIPMTVAVLSLLLPALLAHVADTPFRAAQADGPDSAFAMAMEPISTANLYLAVRTDAGQAGGVGRINTDCREIARWQTGELVDIAIDGGTPGGVAALETWLSAGEPEKRLVRYTATGVRGEVWSVASAAARIATQRSSAEVYVLHAADGSSSARISVQDGDGSDARSWAVPDGARDVDLNQRYRPSVVVASAHPGGAGGSLTHYDYAGAQAWKTEVSVVPAAVAYYSRSVYVVGTAPGAPGNAGRVVRLSEDGTLETAWPTEGLLPLDAVASWDGVRVLGHAPGDPSAVELRHYDANGGLVRQCPTLPQTSQPTPEATAVCPLPTPGAIAWDFAGSGGIESAPAIAADGTAYFGTLDGLMYAVDCAGRQKWVFDYREEGPEFGPQAFHGSPALDGDGTIYIGDDILVPNYFFAVNPDGSVKWTQRFETTYSQIDTSPALSRDGRIFAGAHGWGAGVSSGCILVFDRDGTRHRPYGLSCGSARTGPITDSPVVLENGSVVFAAPKYHEWVLPTGTPTGTPPTATPTSTPSTATLTVTLPTVTATSATPTGTLPTATATTATPTGGTPTTATPTGTPGTPEPTGTPPTRTPGWPPPAPIYLPFASSPGTTGDELAPSWQAGAIRPGDGRAPREGRRLQDPLSSRSGIGASPNQPLPPPYVTVPVPARLHQVHAAATPDTVVDLPGYDNPSSPAADGQTAWFTASGASGPELLAYDFGAARLAHALPVSAPVSTSPVLGRRNQASGELEVFLQGTNGTLVALAVSDTGAVRERWSHQVGMPATGAPALGDDGRVYVAAGLVAKGLDRDSGSKLWTVSLDAPATSSVSLAPGGMLYVGTESGTMYAIGTSSGGLDRQSIWPSYRRDARNTGSVE